MDIAREIIASGLQEEMASMLERHVDEVSRGHDLRYDLNHYATMQKAGSYDLFVGRVDEEIVCYAGYYITADPHHVSNMYAVCDMVYVVPEYRGKYALNKMLAFTDSYFRTKSIKYVTMACRAEHDFSSILKRDGYTITEIVYTKEL